MYITEPGIMGAEESDVYLGDGQTRIQTQETRQPTLYGYTPLKESDKPYFQKGTR